MRILDAPRKPRNFADTRAIAFSFRIIDVGEGGAYTYVRIN